MIGWAMAHLAHPPKPALPGGATPRKQYSIPGPNSLWHIGMQVLVLCV